jgi:hypothetical protein
MAVFLVMISWGVPAVWAVDFFFEPDTIFATVGQTIQLSGRIAPTSPLRSFTIYMAYDTNRIDLADAPTPGALVAGRQGLNFNYLDHRPILPDLLEITATVFSRDFWSGPGDLFYARFQVRQCGVVEISAIYPPVFIDSSGAFPPVHYSSAWFVICGQVPQDPRELTAIAGSENTVTLRWNPVHQDTAGNPLFGVTDYLISREILLPNPVPPTIIAYATDTTWTDTLGTGERSTYRVIARVNSGR